MRPIGPETLVLHCQVAVRPVDGNTGQPSRDKVHAALEVGDRFGRWLPVTRPPVRTDGGVIAWPGLGLTARPAHADVGRYRVTLTAAAHRVAVLDSDRRLATGPLRFDVRPYGHDAPLAAETIPLAREVLLFPASHHPHPSHVPVLRGVVRDAAGSPLVDAIVAYEATRVMTDERGSFGLPLSQARPGEVFIDATTLGGERHTRVSVQVPDALRRGIVIEIP